MIISKIALFIILLLSSYSAWSKGSRAINVFADYSVFLPLTDVAKSFTKQTGILVSINFDFSATEIIKQIEDGGNIDVIIAADQSLFENLKQRGLVDIYNTSKIASDYLLLAFQSGNERYVKYMQNKSLEESLRMMNEGRETLLVDSISSSSGIISREIIKRLKLDNLLILSRISGDKPLASEENKWDKNSFFLLLASQINQNTDKNNLVRFSTISHSDKKIDYRAIIVAGNNMEIAREFLKFLRTKKSIKLFKKSGFVTN